MTSHPTSESLRAPDPGSKLASGQWLVLIAAFLGWMFDGYEQGLFPVVARPALRDLLHGAGDGPVAHWMGIITACFLVGAALGGITFGWLGDRIGRVRAMSASILVYSLVTGLAYFATEPWHLGLVRFVSAIGMGGQWALGVALVMECWPEKWRPALASAMGAAANFGFLLVSVMARGHAVTVESWRWMMVVAALPAFLVVFIIACVPESKRWKAAMKEAPDVNPVKAVFAAGLARKTILGIIFASIALIGTWGSVTWLPLWADQMVGGLKPMAKADTQIVQAIGSIFGAVIAPQIGARLGRRPAFFLLCAASLTVCALLFQTVHAFGPTFLVYAFFVNAATASFYGWFPLYLPELFPTRVRATGQGVCYNSGRLLAAAGALTQGQLVAFFSGSYAKAGSVVTLVYLAGMALIWLAPETKGRPLPE